MESYSHIISKPIFVLKVIQLVDDVIMFEDDMTKAFRQIIKRLATASTWMQISYKVFQGGFCRFSSWGWGGGRGIRLTECKKEILTLDQFFFVCPFEKS